MSEHYAQLTEVARRIKRKQVSPVELTKAMLERIERVDPRLHAYATVTADVALAEAKQAEKEIGAGRYRGPLHGVPIAVKDLCYTKAIPTGAGMTIHRRFRPRHDATVVTRLREAGAVLLGKLQMTEGAFAEHHPEIAAPLNPWNADHWVGSSSSGSGVATAAGLCFASLGSDTGGSIRFPSTANGVTGLKPTWGRVSRHGIFDLAPSLDHIGPMTRSAADCAAVLGVIAGADPDDPTAALDAVPNYLAGIGRGIKGVRIGVDRAFNSKGVAPAMARTCADGVAALQELGAQIVDVAFPNPDAVVDGWARHCGVETAVVHADTYPARKSEYGPGLSWLIELGRALSGEEYQRILLARMDFRGRLAALFEGIDLLAIPAQYLASPTNAEMAELGKSEDAISRMLRFTCPFDMSGNPTITLPSGFTRAGMPIAFQLVAKPMGEALLCRAGHAFQQATDWHKRHPDVE